MTASEDVVKKWIDLASDKKDDVKAVEAFFAEHKGKGLDINVRLQNHSALTNAGRKNNKAVVAWLLKNGADAKKDEPAIGNAILCNSVECVQLMLDAGATPGDQKFFGDLLIDVARKNKWDAMVELLAKGAAGAGAAEKKA